MSGSAGFAMPSSMRHKGRIGSMTAITLGVIASACVFASALVGLFLHQRLPEPHLSKETQDLVKLGTGMISVLSFPHSPHLFLISYDSGANAEEIAPRGTAAMLTTEAGSW